MRVEVRALKHDNKPYAYEAEWPAGQPLPPVGAKIYTTQGFQFIHRIDWTILDGSGREGRGVVKATLFMSKADGSTEAPVLG